MNAKSAACGVANDDDDDEDEDGEEAADMEGIHISLTSWQ